MTDRSQETDPRQFAVRSVQYVESPASGHALHGLRLNYGNGSARRRTITTDLAAGDFQAAATEIDMLASPGRPFRLQNTIREFVDHLLPISRGHHQPGPTQHAQMVRRIGQLQMQFSGQIRDTARPGTQCLNQAQAIGITQSLEQLGTLFYGKRIATGHLETLMADNIPHNPVCENGINTELFDCVHSNDC